jgi:hypothetical protein
MSTINAGSTTPTALTLTGNTDGTLDLSTGGTVRMTINGSGNVGIGTASPTTMLHLAGSAAAGKDTTITLANTTASTGRTYQLISGDGGPFRIYDATAAADRIRIDSSGNVGIGTSSPDAKLTVNGAASFSDGTASAPGIANSGDLDTGMYFPAANEVAVTAGGTVAAAFNSNGLFFRNRVINGDMRIDQRNAGAAVTTSGAFIVDRFPIINTTDGAFSAQQDSSVPTGSGFVNSLKITTTTADATLTAAQTLNTAQIIEGTNVADLMWGSASARTVTLSFWVRSSLTGTFGGSLRNNGGTRSYPFSYSISSADTWEYKTVTIPGDTSGTWLTTNGTGIISAFGLGAGPDRSGTAGAWASANVVAPTGAVSVIGTLNATWYITGVQLETGSVATPFERRPYGTELMLCQRYYFRQYANSGQSFGLGFVYTGNTFLLMAPFPVPMRAAPASLDQTGTASNYQVFENVNVTLNSVPTINSATTNLQGVATGTSASGLDNLNPVLWRSNGTNIYLGWNAEL